MVEIGLYIYLIFGYFAELFLLALFFLLLWTGKDVWK